jgi:hypothetical protein
MGLFSCFAKDQAVAKRNVHSAPATGTPSSEAVELIPDGARPTTSVYLGFLATACSVLGPLPKHACAACSATGRRSAPASVETAVTVVQPVSAGGEFGVAEVFGDAIIRELSSDVWSGREDALHSVQTRLKQEAATSGEMTDRLPLFNACCCILRTSMNDKVAPVYFASCKLLKHLVEDYGKDLRQDDVQSGLMPLMSIMLARTGESNQRVLEGTCVLILQLGRMSNVGLKFVNGYVTEPIKSMRKVKLVLGRLDLARRAVTEFSLADELTPEAIMGVAVPALDQADDKVRKAAVRLVVDVYKIAGKDAVMPQLANCKPAAMTRLQRWFDHADGKPVQAPTKRSGLKLAPLKGGSLPPLQMKSLNAPAKPDMGSHPFGSCDPAPGGEDSTAVDEDEMMMEAILTSS